MSRPRGSIIGAKPAWTTTSTSGIWPLRQAEEMLDDGKWPRGPVAPTSLAGTGADTEVALTWTAPATAHGTITNYAVEYTPSGGSATVVLADSTAESYTVTGLTNDTEYTFRVAAINHTQGEWSTSVAVTPAAGGSYDISTASLANTFSIAAQTTEPRGFTFSRDGLNMYITDNNSAATVFQYSLSTAWDLSSAAFVQSHATSAYGYVFGDLAISSDGTKALFALGPLVANVTLTTPFDITTASNPTSSFSNLNNTTGSILGVAAKDDGSGFYVAGTNSYNLFQYSMTNWNATTASLVHTFVDYKFRGALNLDFDDSGEFLMAGSTGNGSPIERYSMATPYDLSTATITTKDLSAQDSGMRGALIKSGGGKLFTLGNTNDSVYEYSLS